jgi:Na+/H+ antiporter NhaD/arsenite permease-like protein
MHLAPALAPAPALPLLSALPFALLLLAIAILPLVAPHLWERNRNRALVAAACAVPFAAWLFLHDAPLATRSLQHAALDYASFLSLLFSLFVISGGIFVRGSLAGTPLSNTAILAVGAVLANLVGTTGASVLLIRPLLRANARRDRVTHTVVFFIFIVANCGGLLTPLGDPPLFLGFLKGVPFSWTLGLWKQWLLVNGILLVAYNLLDQAIFDREERSKPGSQLEEVMEHVPLGVVGGHNLLFLLGIVLVVVGRGAGWFAGGAGAQWRFGVQEGLMLALAAAAWFSTKHEIRAANGFTFAPIVEVAILFAGIFVTMVSPLLILNARGAELGLERPWQYFWAAGTLSSFLDNAPTYLTFAATAAGQAGVSVEGPRYLAEYLATGPSASALLAAISCGAVFMGANTYIGNGPNFMVRAIAVENGVKMPSFFGYMAWSAAVLLPTFAVVTASFFRAA